MATHKELITSGKFDEKFKRALLDYYNYGFKNLGSFEAKKRQTVSEDWLRLNRVLSDYLEWSENCNSVMFKLWMQIPFIEYIVFVSISR